jgi:SOS-response transcriptional repressor LexA
VSEDCQDILEAIYAFIQAYIAEHGFSPSIREIADACFLSIAATARYLDKLEGAGRISRLHGQPRTIRLFKSD